MNEELSKAADEILSEAGQSAEYKRRLLKLIENITTDNATDADVRQVIQLAEASEED